ncbi:hypothetical protein KC717_05620 [Candidatus Dojkabacteria bacterium]|uniref:Uncharacterized protein n=1 Tax=Candidatus Dojkabacteria bacterium TaxID=2099670 RepID=A0A955L9N6_9BACT|nr:hypothetical protein [Candidatus Dojkabacteria bacterium]
MSVIIPGEDINITPIREITPPRGDNSAGTYLAPHVGKPNLHISEQLRRLLARLRGEEDPYANMHQVSINERCQMRSLKDLDGLLSELKVCSQESHDPYSSDIAKELFVAVDSIRNLDEKVLEREWKGYTAPHEYAHMLHEQKYMASSIVSDLEDLVSLDGLSPDEKHSAYMLIDRISCLDELGALVDQYSVGDPDQNVFIYESIARADFCRIMLGESENSLSYMENLCDDLKNNTRNSITNHTLEHYEDVLDTCMFLSRNPDLIVEIQRGIIGPEEVREQVFEGVQKFNQDPKGFLQNFKIDKKFRMRLHQNFHESTFQGLRMVNMIAKKLGIPDSKLATKKNTYLNSVEVPDKER